MHIDAYRSSGTSGGGWRSVFHVLTDTPEQAEDLLIVLVDDDVVVRFELPRRDADCTKNVQRYTADEYRNQLPQRATLEFEAAMASARNELANR